LVSALAVDWLAKNIYILDAGLRKIVVCSLRLVTCNVLDTNVFVGQLVSLALDPQNG